MGIGNGIAMPGQAALGGSDQGVGQRERQWGFAGAAVLILVTAGVAATPFAATPLPPVAGSLAAFSAAMVVVNLLLAAMLFSRGAIEGCAESTALATAYLFVAAIFVLPNFGAPGGIMDGATGGATNTQTWLWASWHVGFGLAIIRYARVARRGARRAASMSQAICTVLAVVTALAVLATAFGDWLPEVRFDGRAPGAGASGLAPLVSLSILLVATVRVLRLGARSPEQLWLAVAMVAGCLDVWLSFQGGASFSLGWYLGKWLRLASCLTMLMSLLHQSNLQYSRMAAANKVLVGLARLDGLTGLVNRRALDEAIDLEWRKSRRDRQPVSLLMIDVDHFKRFNDRYGHPAGDDCLRRVAAALQSVALRPGDLAARYGGEEFALLMPDTDADGAAEIAARLRLAVRGLAIPHGDSPFEIVSVSIGVASVMARPDSEVATLVAAADRALYRAKAAGRDTFCRSDDRLLIDVAVAA